VDIDEFSVATLVAVITRPNEDYLADMKEEGMEDDKESIEDDNEDESDAEEEDKDKQSMVVEEEAE